MDLTENEKNLIALFDDYQIVNETLLVNKFNLNQEEGKALLEDLYKKNILYKVYYYLCPHCNSLCDDGALFETKDKVSLRKKYSCWNCKQKFKPREGKMIITYSLKDNLIKEIK